MKTSATILYLSHGGGPLPLLGDPAHTDMVATLEQVARDIGKPSAILVISAHWEESVATVTTGASPELIYDYYGFPEESYQITYPAQVEPELANAVLSALTDAGIQAIGDAARGFDHGLFIPLKIMYPDADIPCVQLSLLNSLDAEAHLRLGEALQGLDYDNLLVIGSGFSFHNMRAFFAPDTPDAESKNIAFDDWLTDTCTDTTLTESVRRSSLRDWEQAPQARYCHPREEHLLPLQVCYGLAASAANTSYRCKILGKHASMFLWQPGPAA